MDAYRGLLGLVVIMAFAWLCSSQKRAIKLRVIAWGLGLQLAFAVLVLKTPFSNVLQKISDGVIVRFHYQFGIGQVFDLVEDLAAS